MLLSKINICTISAKRINVKFRANGKFWQHCNLFYLSWKWKKRKCYSADDRIFVLITTAIGWNRKSLICRRQLAVWKTTDGHRWPTNKLPGSETGQTLTTIAGFPCFLTTVGCGAGDRVGSGCVAARPTKLFLPARPVCQLCHLTTVHSRKGELVQNYGKLAGTRLAGGWKDYS